MYAKEQLSTRWAISVSNVHEKYNFDQRPWCIFIFFLIYIRSSSDKPSTNWLSFLIKSGLKIRIGKT